MSGIKLIDNNLLENILETLQSSPRKRTTFEISDSHSESPQIIINAIDTSSYIRPHKHQDPDKSETIIPLLGKIVLIDFYNDGLIRDIYEISPRGRIMGAYIKPHSWHTFFALENKSVVIESITGPYDEKTHKKYAPWAPEENDSKANEYFERLKIEASLHLLDKI